MDLQLLRGFVRVADAGTFTAAARRYGVTQPTLSRAVAKLEEELGQPVFERQGRSLALTDAGRLLRERAGQILGLVDDLKSEITDDGETGRVRVGAIPTIAPYFLPPLLERFKTERPRAAAVVREEVTDQCLELLNRGELDLAIVALPLPRPTAAQYLEVTPLFEEPLRLVLHPGHELAGRPTVSARDVEPEPFILLGEAHCLTEHVLDYCRRKSVQPVAVERTSQLAMVQELVALGHGVSLIPEMAAVKDDSPRRVYRKLRGPEPTRTIAIARNPYRFESKLVKAFRESVTA
ncbi:MAG: hydrogen peroxide-inducible genes activator [Planctomycetota bacterium]